jgi:hypothetical protein
VYLKVIGLEDVNGIHLVQYRDAGIFLTKEMLGSEGLYSMVLIS